MRPTATTELIEHEMENEEELPQSVFLQSCQLNPMYLQPLKQLLVESYTNANFLTELKEQQLQKYMNE